MKAQKLYLPSIACVAIVIPVILTLIGIGVIKGLSSSKMGGFETSKQEYQSDQAMTSQIAPVKAKHDKIKDQLEEWVSITTADGYTMVNNTVRQAVEINDQTKTMQVISGQKAEPLRGLNKSLADGSAFTIEGTFTELQNVMLYTESHLPNLLLGSMTISPQRGGKLLEMKLNFNSWKSKK